MDYDELLELQDNAYKNILIEIANEEDPEKLQQLANAAAQLEKGRNDALKISNDFTINQQKIDNEEKNREDDKLTASKQSKTDKAWKLFDGALALIGCAAGIVLAFKTKSEEEDSYPKQPKTDMKASQLFDRAWKKNR